MADIIKRFVYDECEHWGYSYHDYLLREKGIYICELNPRYSIIPKLPIVYRFVNTRAGQILRDTSLAAFRYPS